ncbi:endothelin-converting enzyme 1, partial [Elysia marginata]
MLEIEDSVAQPQLQYHHVHDRFSLYNTMTIAELEYNFTMLNWVQYFLVMGFDVDSETEVVVMYPSYMDNITDFIRSFHDAPEAKKRDLRDYLALSVLRSFKQYFERDIFEIKNTGRQYDGEGKLSDWWNEETSKRFGETTTCMRDQYGNITVRGARVDGDFTLDENIADNGGLRAAMF